MIINLSDPFWSTLIGGLLVFVVSMGIAGIIKFSIISHQKKLIEDSFFRLRAELESIQKVFQNEITKSNEELTAIKKRDTEIKKILAVMKDRIDNTVKQVPSPHYLDPEQKWLKSKK